MTEYAHERLDRHERLHALIAMMRDKQVAYAVVRCCANQVMVHMMRNTPHEPLLAESDGHARSPLARHDVAMRRCFEAIFGSLTEEQWGQVQLTAADGGFGILSQRRRAPLAELAGFCDAFRILHSRVLSGICGTTPSWNYPTCGA